LLGRFGTSELDLDHYTPSLAGDVDRRRVNPFR
jgi:hypothetical protein